MCVPTNRLVVRVRALTIPERGVISMIGVKAAAALGLLGILLLPACGGDDGDGGDGGGGAVGRPATAEGEPIKIGVLLEFTGAGADYGRRGRQMINLALDEVDR